MDLDLTGTSCGVYEVWGPITEGGMSRVWLGRHRELGTPVIIKTLLESGPDSYELLRDEARMMARIPSPRVVHAVDLGVHDGCPYLVQEYVDGLDLAELDRRRRKALGRGLPLRFVCRVVRDTAEALQSAHQTGVLHRDVKPSNLFGSPQTGIRLGDFGIATARGATKRAGTGTLRFISPEALRGETPGRQCDVYSLGATAYDLYYGTPPFPGLTELLSDAPATFPRARTAEEAYFQHVVAQMLDRDLSARFATLAIPLRRLTPLAQWLSHAPVTVQLGRGHYRLGQTQIRCVVGDLADSAAAGIVNSANTELSMRAGVSACLRERGGDAIEAEAMSSGRRALGECFATSGGKLACKNVLHAVSAWKEASCIGRTFQRALLLAEELDLRTLAVPAIGTGHARVSVEACAYATASALYYHLLLGGSRLEEVTFVLYNKEVLDLFVEELNGVFLGDPEVEEREAAPPEEVALEETIQLPAMSVGGGGLDAATARSFPGGVGATIK